MVTIPGLEGLNYAGIGGQVAYYFGFFLVFILIMVAFGALYYFTAFPIKATVFPLYGSGKDGIFSVGVKRNNKVKWVKNRTAWRSMLPLFNKIDREPFDAEYIYPGKGKKKEIYIFDLNGNWSPGRININKTEDQMRAEINSVPHAVRAWQSLQHKQNAIEFAKTGFWEQNKGFFITLGVVLICCILCGAVVYFTYKYAAGGREDARMISDAIRGFASAGGQGVTVPN